MTFIPRFKDKVALARKILSPLELKEYENSFNKEEYLASRFALKEALIKCLELSILSVNLNEIIVKKKESGAVYIEYQNKVFSCSLSHENEYCLGVVVDE